MTQGFKFQLLLRNKGGGVKFIVPSNAFAKLRDNKDGVRYVIIIKRPSSVLGRNLMIKYSKALIYALFVFLKIWM